jgi:hypothetical protein
MSAPDTVDLSACELERELLGETVASVRCSVRSFPGAGVQILPEVIYVELHRSRHESLRSGEY